jgi:hypothetical protein
MQLIVTTPLQRQLKQKGELAYKNKENQMQRQRADRLVRILAARIAIVTLKRACSPSRFSIANSTWLGPSPPLPPSPPDQTKQRSNCRWGLRSPPPPLTRLVRVSIHI